jgi:uncharacterized membrane protein
MKLGFALLFGLLALPSESAITILLAALAGWLLGELRQQGERLSRVERELRDSATRSRLSAAPTPQPVAASSSESAPAETAADAAADRATDSNALDLAARTGSPTPASASAVSRVAPTAAAPSRTGGAATPPALPPRSPLSPVVRPTPAPTAIDAASDVLIERLQALLFGGNLPVKMGVLVLFAGVAAALRYAAQQGYLEFPIGLRLLGLSLLGIAGLLFGLAQRTQRPSFGLALQGGSIGILLLITFAAFRLYALLPPGLALTLVVALVAIAAALAVWQDAAALAVLGFLGGYLGPVLINSGSGDHIALFSYYAALNAAVFAVAWWRHWYPLNLIGFLFTFGLGSLWGLENYESADYPGVQAFLLLFWGFYLGIVVLGALRQGAASSRRVEASLSFGLPLWAFSLQAGLLEGDRSALTAAALLAAAAYALLAAWLLRLPHTRLQGESFAWIAAGFLTLSIPLAFSAEQTSAIWALQGAGAMWLGLRQGRLLPQAAGWMLQAVAAAAFVFSVFDSGLLWSQADLADQTGLRITLALLALAGFVGSYLYERLARQRATVWPLFALGSAWLGLLWLHFGWRPPLQLEGIHALIAVSALFAALAAGLRQGLAWPRLSWQIVLQLALSPLLALIALADIPGPLLQGSGAWIWALWAGLSLLVLHGLREPPARLTGLAHLSVLAVAAGVLGLDLAERAQRAEWGEAWLISLALLPAIGLSVGLWRSPQRLAWPLQQQFSGYAGVWHLLAGLTFSISWLAALLLAADPAPWVYLPVLNPLELLQWTLLLAAWRLLPSESADAVSLRAGVAVAALALVSVTLLRCVHHYAGLPWSPSIFDSALTQACLSVLWALAGVSAWIYGSRQERWPVWLGGALLMGVVLVKLVLVDRVYLGNLAGIGAVLTVGLLLVAVGYVAPSPPRRVAAESA